MNGKELMEGLSYLSEEYVQQAQDAPKRKRKPLRMWGTLAACLCVLLLGVWGFLPRAEKSEEFVSGENLQQEADGCIPEIGKSEVASPDELPAEEIRLVVDHWEEGKLYVKAEETGNVFLVVWESEAYTEAILQPGTGLIATVTDWNEEQGVLYVKDLKPLN